MSITLENKIKVLEYKLAYEQEIKIAKEFSEGNADLNYRLSFFREKIKNSVNPSGVSHHNIYDSMFKTGGNTGIANIVLQDDDGLIQESSKKNNNIDKWAKKVYIRIVKSTHPDITMHINSKDLRIKFSKIYNIAQKAYENNNLSDLIMSAYELDIDVPNEVIQENISPAYDKKQKSIISNKSKLGWQWYHVPEINKDAELKKILSMLGFEFTDMKIKDVIKSKRPTRKTGRRPEKINVKRKKLK